MSGRAAMTEAAGRSSSPTRAFATLAATEALERFAYCGAQILLILYLAQPAVTDAMLGVAWLRPILGGGDAAARAMRLYGLFAAATYLAPLAGALVADRLGRRETVALGCGLMTAGHAVLASERWLPAALALLVAGAGCTLSNRLAMVGELFDDGARRTTGFARYLAATNVGVIAAPAACGALAERWGWTWGFGAAAVGMALGGMVYLAGWRWLPGDAPAAGGRAAPRPRPPLRALFLLLAPFVIVTVVLNQAYTTVPIWATDHLDRRALGWTLPVTALITFDGVATLLAIALVTRWWRSLAARGREPGDVGKLAIGCAIVAAAFALLAAVSAHAPAPLVGALAFYVVLDLSAAWIEPPTAALIARLSPVGRSAAPLAAMKAATALAALLLGWAGGFYAPLGPARLWTANALVALAAAATALAVGGVLRRAAGR